MAQSKEKEIDEPQKSLTFTEKQLAVLKDSIKRRQEKENINKDTDIEKDLEFLIVEDMHFSRLLLKHALSPKGTCYTAEDVLPALEAYALHAPSVCFLDIDLPNGSGHTLATLIREADPDCYIVMVTASKYKRDIDIAHANKVKDFVVKPFNLQRIFKCLDKYITYRKKKG